MSGTSRPRLAFSTLACPEWAATTVIERAAAGGWDGVEWRGGPEGTVSVDWTAERRRTVRAAMASAGLDSIAVTTYTNLVSGDPAVVRASVADAVAHAELAADLGAPAIRVFLGERDDDGSPAVLERRAIEALDDLLQRVRASGVVVAIEPHDEHVHAESIRPILDALPDARLGVVWDIGNAWSVGEAPDTGLAAYRGRIAWVQVKDGTGRDGTWRLGDLGAGDVPIDAALAGLVRAVAADGVDLPPISLEWERAWHDELEPAAVALPPAQAWLREHVTQAVERGGSPP
ncbi:MAG TPA: sugar phosphate isomerase/epimerase family protein [Candidatus Limnocylindrales bacterium]|nr:sugar phosphate isomerase/epimerase family protein [Candidatus Limnocylindrales bacterium]